MISASGQGEPTRASPGRELKLGSTAPRLGCRSGRFRRALAMAMAMLFAAERSPCRQRRNHSMIHVTTTNGDNPMSFVSTKDGVEVYYKDWGRRNAQPIMFHHGWPLSADDWDTQMLYFVGKGYRVVAHDRRGHGRSSQVSEGHDMDHYAADVAAVVEHLELRDAVHVGHSTGGGARQVPHDHGAEGQRSALRDGHQQQLDLAMAHAHG